MTVKKQRAAGAELRELAHFAPADELIAVFQYLEIALAVGAQRRAVGELAHERDRAPAGVHAHDDAPRLAFHRGRGTVVEDAD